MLESAAGKYRKGACRSNSSPKVRGRAASLFSAIVLLAALVSCGHPAGGTQGPPENGDIREPSTGVFPSLRLTIAADEIHRTIWAPNIMVSLENAGQAYEFANATAQVRGRGNSTWHFMGDKRPFRIRFDSARPMFGSAYSARDWTVIANAMDYSLMRQYSAYFLGRMLDGQCFAPAGHFVHVYLDGEYRGVYMVSDQMQVLVPGRAELASNLDPALSEYFLEWCGRSGGDEFSVVVQVAGNARSQDIPFVIDFPGGGILRQGLGHKDFVAGFLDDVSRAIHRGHRDEISRLIDLNSFVDFYLVQELFKNHDSFWSSLFFQIRQVEGSPRLFAGPLWDFDHSSGGGDDGVSDYSPRGAWVARWNGWFRSLMGTEWFSQQAARRWNEIRGVEVARMIGRIWELAETYRSCFERNFERWPDKLGQYLWRTPPEVQAIPDFIGNVEYLVDWLERRIVWMNGFFAQNLRTRVMQAGSDTPVVLAPPQEAAPRVSP